MKRLLAFSALIFGSFFTALHAQDPWKITASPVNASGYYGVTVANGMIGIVSSPEPFKVKDVVLAGAYDQYGRGRVSNFLRSFNLLNMRLGIDGKDLGAGDIQNLKQELDMQKAGFTCSFDYSDKASIRYTYYSLRHLPFTVLMDVSITVKKDLQLSTASVMEAPDALKDVQNYYNEIDRPHVTISLLTSSAKSPTGKLLMCASNTFLFEEAHGTEPRVIHEMWDNNMHLMKFTKKLKAGTTYRFSIAGSSSTSATIGMASPPPAMISLALCSATSRLRPSITGIPPAAAIPLTNAPPRIPVPPVTTITFPFSENNSFDSISPLIYTMNMILFLRYLFLPALYIYENDVASGSHSRIISTRLTSLIATLISFLFLTNTRILSSCDCITPSTITFSFSPITFRGVLCSMKYV